MTTINLTIIGDGAGDVAYNLLGMAEYIEVKGEAAIPPPGTVKPVRIDDELVGVFSVPDRLSFEDGVKLVRALDRPADVETIEVLDQAHEALNALVNALRALDLPLAQYPGLLTAIDIVGSSLSEHSYWIKDFLERDANDGL